MAIRITRIDDIDGTDGAEAITLELDHTSYEIDLCPRNRARLFRVIRPFIERARALELEGNGATGELPASSETQYRRPNVVDVVDVSEETQSSSSGLDLIEMAREMRD
jgi:Lsr2